MGMLIAEPSTQYGWNGLFRTGVVFGIQLPLGLAVLAGAGGEYLWRAGRPTYEQGE